MTNADAGLSAEILKNFGYALVLGALVSWVLLARSVDDGFTTQAAIWLAAGVVTTVAAGTCAVVVAVKLAETRLRRDRQPSV